MVRLVIICHYLIIIISYIIIITIINILMIIVTICHHYHYDELHHHHHYRSATLHMPLEPILQHNLSSLNKIYRNPPSSRLFPHIRKGSIL